MLLIGGDAGPSQNRKKKGQHKAINTKDIELIQDKLEWKESGVPTGPHRQRFVSYLGEIARNYFSPHERDWQMVDKKMKNTVWTFIQVSQRYKLLGFLLDFLILILFRIGNLGFGGLQVSLG